MTAQNGSRPGPAVVRLDPVPGDLAILFASEYPERCTVLVVGVEGDPFGAAYTVLSRRSEVFNVYRSMLCML